jgi:hypothetical protein
VLKAAGPNVRIAPIVLKKSPPNTLGPFPRNNDSIAKCISNHRCVTKARRDWKLRVKLVLRLFQHNPPEADLQLKRVFSKKLHYRLPCLAGRRKGESRRRYTRTPRTYFA